MMSTEKARSGHGVYLRWLNMLLLSLNTVLLVIPVVSVRMKYPVLMIGQRIFYFLFARWLFQFQRPVRTAPLGWTYSASFRTPS
jgi:hypothetical protein